MNFPLHSTRLIVEKSFSFPDLFVALLCETFFFYIIGNFAACLYGGGLLCGYCPHKGGTSH